MLWIIINVIGRMLQQVGLLKKVKIRKMSYILLWIITFAEITLGKENLRNSKNKDFSFWQN
jgi:hypothetical protein